jgi:NAD(P)-dependent dehydrogenase (short-subunit alcohol dehydrogenase family)
MFENTIMLITGASRGIGAATAEMAAQRGATVFINYRSNHDAANAVVGACRSTGSQAAAFAGDVSNEEDVLAMYAECISHFGPPNVLVNNAGILHNLDRVENYTAQRLHEVVNVNIVGAFLCAREAVKVMSNKRGGNGGSIVNVSSAASYLGSPNEYVDYAATKGAMDTMTVGLAREVADEGIRVNAVRPGLIETDMHEGDRLERLWRSIPMQRTGTADEVAEAILFLASDASSYVNGALLNVSGAR